MYGWQLACMCIYVQVYIRPDRVRLDCVQGDITMAYVFGTDAIFEARIDASLGSARSSAMGLIRGGGYGYASIG